MSKDPELEIETFHTSEVQRRIEIEQTSLRGLLEGSDLPVAAVGDILVFEGDILVTPADQEVETKGAVTNDLTRTWHRGLIHYVVEDEIEEIFKAAVSHWEERTPLRFVHGIAPDFVAVAPGASASQVGRQGGPQSLFLKPGCSLGTAIHEIGHLIGLLHEHSRPDRDDHIRVLEGNILPGSAAQFERFGRQGRSEGSYDVHSIMHYPSRVFSKDPATLPTIVLPDGAEISPSSELSTGDVAAVRALYHKLNW